MVATEARAVNFNQHTSNQWGVKIYTRTNGRITKIETVTGRGNRSYALRVARTWNTKFANA